MYLNNTEIEKFIDQHDKDAKAIKEELFKLCWYMRGGLSISEAYFLSPDERSIVINLIEENLETTKTSGLPFF